VTKDRLVEVLSKINSGEDAGYYHDEIETVIGVLLDSVTQEDVDKAFAGIRDDETKTEG
jgi:hypothetical protein